MLRLIFYIILFILAIYLLLWLKAKWNRLQPQTKKQIVSFGLLGLFRLLKYKWRTILSFLFRLLKK